MPSIRLPVWLLPLLLLPGCASNDSIGKCLDAGACPIVISKKFPNRFVASPSFVRVKTGSNAVLVWMFADHGEYYFDVANPPYADRDRIQLLSADGGALGVVPCFATNSPSGGYPPAPQGLYYRCEIKGNAEEFVVHYDVFFRGKDNIQRKLDPTVTHTGDPHVMSTAPIPFLAAPKAPVLVSATLVLDGGGARVDPATLTLPAQEAHVIWAAPQDHSFVTNPPNGSRDAVRVNASELEACYATETATSTVGVAEGRFFRCVFFGNYLLPVDYEITFRKRNSPQLRAQGKLAR
ncbi:MAG TPA: hypothetical protein VHM00_05035 [Caldimonas sp.]|jgi:hypothetical protein|nr:hypothetical protein [Caldimonas sp.]HEX2540429.1 hypothetical protein [Caldimonas sp.]